eukprot:TRINITY_DN305_c0_g1_i1.p2 TRINITY_DN305_c0_g1~~TRINITY_DN305_c0_g1_i1.p2  ORF type:complete len:234 (-),score=35.93 TRINITY_DN305_c0_g1_i1:661-1362(-)
MLIYIFLVVPFICKTRCRQLKEEAKGDLEMEDMDVFLEDLYEDESLESPHMENWSHPKELVKSNQKTTKQFNKNVQIQDSPAEEQIYVSQNSDLEEDDYNIDENESQKQELQFPISESKQQRDITQTGGGPNINQVVDIRQTGDGPSINQVVNNTQVDEFSQQKVHNRAQLQTTQYFETYDQQENSSSSSNYNSATILLVLAIAVTVVIGFLYFKRRNSIQRHGWQQLEEKAD